MIEIAPDLMAALEAEAEKRGRSVSEIASEAIQEWIDPTPWFGLDGEETPTSTNCDMEPEIIELPKEGETYLAHGKEGNFLIKVISIQPLFKPIIPPHEITLSFPDEDGSEDCERDTIPDWLWKKLAEHFNLTLQPASDARSTRVSGE